MVALFPTRTILFALVALISGAASQTLATTLADGQEHIISEETARFDPYSVRDSLDGRATTLRVIETGLVWSEVHVYDSSALVLDRGVIWGMIATHGTSKAYFLGGSNQDDVKAYDSSTIRIAGGTPGNVYAHDSSLVEIVGSGFAINGVPVGYGSISALTPDLSVGRLTGFLSDGTPLDIFIGSGSPPGPTYWSGEIILADEPDLLALAAIGLVAITSFRRLRPGSPAAGMNIDV